MPVLGKGSLAKLNGVHPDLVALMIESIKDCPVDFTITDGVRTTKEQQALYAKGRTVKGGIVTNADGIKNKSNHQVKSDGLGHAIDLVPYINGSINWNATNEFKIIATHIKATAKCMGIKVVWGGDWTKEKEGIIDMPHFELSK